MSKFLVMISVFSFLISQAGINDLEEVIVSPRVLAFKTKAKTNAWTIQTIARNYDVYGLQVFARPDSVQNLEGIPVKHYSSDQVKIEFSEWSTEIEKDTSKVLGDLVNFNSDLAKGLRNKLAMIGYLNRKKLPFLETFFQRTYTVGARQYKTTLEKPINVVDYEENKFMIYQDNFNVFMITTQREYTFSKNDYEWSYTNKELHLYPTAGYVKRKPINAIKSGRDWYNGKWEELRKERKLSALVNSAGLIWNTAGLSDSEKNLVDWFKKN